MEETSFKPHRLIQDVSTNRSYLLGVHRDM